MARLIAIGVFVVVFALGVIVLGRTSGRAAHKRHLATRLARPARAADVVITRPPRRRERERAASLARLNPLRKLEENIWQAGLDLRLAELLVIMAGLAGGVLMLALALGHDLTIAIATATIGGLAPIGFVRWRRGRRSRAFLQQLPFALDLIKSSLEAGHSLNRGLQVMVAEFADPLSGEFRTALEQTRIGLPLPLALEEMLRRVPEADLRLLVIAVKINHEAGASLARIVGRLAEVIRMRQRVRLQIKALTAQSRLGGYIVGGLPIIVLALFSLIQPAYTQALFTDPAGVRILKLALVMEGLAALTIRQMLKLKD